MGWSPWGRQESDTTERLHFHFSLSYIGEGNGNPLQYSCWENPRNGGAWWAAIYGVAQSWTRLKQLSSRSSSHFYKHTHTHTHTHTPIMRILPGPSQVCCYMNFNRALQTRQGHTEAKAVLCMDTTPPPFSSPFDPHTQSQVTHISVAQADGAISEWATSHPGKMSRKP